MIRLDRRNYLKLRKTIQIIGMDIFDMLDGISKTMLPVHFRRFFKKIQRHPHGTICDTVKPYLDPRLVRRNDLFLHFPLRP